MFETTYASEKKKKQSTVTRVKLFADSEPLEVEKKLNEWLYHNDIEIKHVGQSQSEKGGRLVFVMSVFY